MNSASMELLKGGKKAAVEAALATGKGAGGGNGAKAAGEAGEETVEIDLDTVTGKEMDALVKEHGIAIEGWGKTVKTVEQKRAALKTHFAEPPAAGPEAGVPLPKGKRKAKGGEIVEAGVKSGEVLGKDLLATTAHQLENLKEEQARRLARQLADDTEFNHFKFGGVLAVIHANGWFAPFGSFKDYVETEFNLGYRKAMYLVDIYNKMIELGITWDQVKSVSWTKMKEILNVLDGSNIEHWLTIAAKSTTLQLIEHVQKAKAKDDGSGGEATVKAVTTKTFKVHDDQKAIMEAAIDKAKQESGSAVDTVALEYICLDYLNGQPKKGKAKGRPIEAQMKSLGYESVLAAFEKAFPNINLTVEVEDGDGGGDDAV